MLFYYFARRVLLPRMTYNVVNPHIAGILHKLNMIINGLTANQVDVLILG